jgi:sugar/nucleoside kinase (ribokinase family)
VQAIAVARQHGCTVAMTAGDAGVVRRHGPEMWAALSAGVDILFTNAGEAAALLEQQPLSAATIGHGKAATAAAAPAAGWRSGAEAEELALRLGPHCGLVVVTDGDRGSHISALGQLHTVPPCWGRDPPLDTCGAGDAYAAGLLFSFLQQHDLVTMGRTAARVATTVIARHGAALDEDAAAALAPSLTCTRAHPRQPAMSAAELAPTTPRA